MGILVLRSSVTSGGSSPASGDSNFNFATQSITGTPAILDLRQDYSSPALQNNVIWVTAPGSGEFWQRDSTHEYIAGGGFYGQGCARFVPGSFLGDVNNENGDHPCGVGQLLGFHAVAGGQCQIVTVGILWRHGSTVLSESNGIKSLIMLRDGGQSTRPMIIPRGDWLTTGSGGGTVTLPACDGTKCNTREIPGATDEEDNNFNDPATGVPDISGPWEQWVWTEASLDLTQTPSLFHVRSWLANGDPTSGALIAKYLNEGSGGGIPGVDVIGFFNSVASPTASCWLEVERVEVHIGQFGPITPPTGFPGSTR